MKIKWGVIGCGGIADRRTLPGMMLAKNAELVAVMDNNMAAAASVKEKYGAAYAFDNVEDLLDLDEIQAVYIASPVFCHKDQAIKAAKAKKHILIEKPIGLTVAESTEIAEVCCQNGVKFGVGCMMRFHTYHQEMKRIISAGEIGEIVSAHAQFTCWYPDIENAWRQKKELGGGGAMLDMGIHCIDLIRYISGLEAREVVGMNANILFDYEVEESGSVIMRMDNGALCCVEANFNIPDDAGACRLEFYGSNGSIVAEGTLSQVEGGKVEVRRCKSAGYDANQQHEAAKAETLEMELGNMYTKEIEQFGIAIQQGTEFLITAGEAIASQRIIEAAYGSDGKKSYINI